MAIWTARQVQQHRRAARILTGIMRQAFAFMQEHRQKLTDFDVHEFILERFEVNGLRRAPNHLYPIVAFGVNTSLAHYYPTRQNAKQLTEGPVMIDIWGRVGETRAPFADITWCGYCGSSVPDRVRDTFRAVCQARDGCVEVVRDLIHERTVSWVELDWHRQDVMREHGIDYEYMVHLVGHVLGLTSPHGRETYGKSGKHELMRGCAYAIEPGVYYLGEFGCRSEINMLITEYGGIEITTPPQEELMLLEI